MSDQDLRGQVHRHVHRDDSVTISGAEYLRKTSLALEAEYLGALVAERDALQAQVEEIRAEHQKLVADEEQLSTAYSVQLRRAVFADRVAAALRSDRRAGS